MLHDGKEVSPTGYDAVRVFNEKGTDRFAIGIDVNDGYKFKVSLGGALGTNDRVTIATGGMVGVNKPTPAGTVHIKNIANNYPALAIDRATGGLIFMVWEPPAGDGHVYVFSVTGQARTAIRAVSDSYFLDEVAFGRIGATEAIDIDSDAIRLRQPQTPATAGAAGTTGMICWSTGHIYVAVGTNEWERAALSSW